MQSVMLETGPPPAGASIEDVITASRQQSSRERLDVYCNAYQLRLLECLRDEFATLGKFLGDDVFNALAAAYLQAHPSRSHTLSQLGANFPGFLSNSAAAFEGSQFLIDLATLERVYAEVFDGPGVEGLPLITPADLRAIRPDQWPGVRFKPAPCLRLLEFKYPVHEFVTACRHAGEPTVPDSVPTWLAVTRRQYIVRRVPLSEPQFALLKLLSTGHPLGDALDQVATLHDDLEDFAQHIQNWFREWTAAAFFLSVETC